MSKYLLKFIIVSIFSFSIINAFSTNLIVGIYDNNPLVYIDENERPQGLFVDILDEIAFKENWKLEYRFDTWSNLLQLLANEEIDILVNIAYTEARKNLYSFNQTNVFVNWGKIYSRRNLNINSFLDLEGKIVAGVEGDIYFQSLIDILKSFSIEFTILPVEDYVDVFLAIEEGNADAGTVNRMYGMKYFQDYKIDDTVIIFRPTELRYAAPLNKRSIILSTIDFHLNQMKRDKNSVYYKSLETHVAGNYEPNKNVRKVIRIAAFWFLSAIVLMICVFILLKKKKIILSSFFNLRKSLTQISSIEDKIPLPCIHFNLKGVITYVNTSFTDFSGSKYSDLLHKNIFDYFSYFNLNELSKNTKLDRIFTVKDNKSFTVFKAFFKDEMEFVAISMELPEVERLKKTFNIQQENLNAIFNFFSLPMLICDVNGQIVDVNEKLIKHFEFNTKENFFKHNHTLWDIMDLHSAEKIVNNTLKNINSIHYSEHIGFFFNYHHQEIKSEFNILNVSDFESLNYEKTERFFIIVNDLSSQEKIKNDFLMSTEFFKELFENSPLSILVLDKNERVLDANINFEQNFGYSREKILNKNLTEFFVSSEYKAEALKHFDKIIKTGMIVTETYRQHSDGRMIKVLLHGSVIKIMGEIVGVFEIYRDITEESFKLNQLTTMQNKYDILIKSSQDIIAMVDQEGMVIDVSDSLSEITGWTKADVFERSKIIDLVHDEDKENVIKSFSYILKSKCKSHKLQYRFLHKKGHYIWIEEIGSYIENCHNNLAGVLFLSRDISETKEIEESNLTQKKFFKQLMNYFDEALIIVNHEEKIEFCNNTFIKWAEQSLEDIQYTHYYNVFECLSNADKRLPHNVTSNVFVSLNNIHLNFKVSNKRILADLSIIPYADFYAKDKTVIIISDITRFKKLNLEINKIKNIDTLQNYTLHLANDFNNVLTAIMGHISLLKMTPDLPSFMTGRILKAEEAAFKAVEITQKIFPLQNVSKLLKTKFLVSDLFKDIIPDGITFIFNEKDRKHLLRSNFIMLREIIKIIIENAIESINVKYDKGIIRVQIDEEVIKNQEILPLPCGEYTVININDNGIGIKEEYLDDIFEPYFSTKNKEGFGLTKALHLLRILSGHLVIDSKENHSTTASIYIPKGDTTEIYDEYPDINLNDINIMFMDDETLVQDIAIEFMSKLGFKIDVAKNGEEVLEKSKDKDYDFYILDLIVDEGMGARETAMEIKKVKKDAKLLLTTGMKTEKAFFEYKNIGFIEIIEKPIDFYLLKNRLLKIYKENKS